MSRRASTLPFPVHERTESTASDTKTLTGTVRDYDSTRRCTPDSPTYPTPPMYIPTILGEGRTLVLCFDGTSERFDDDNSNIVDFFSLLKREDTSQQVVYYQTGFGTFTSSHVSTPILTKLSQGIDMAIAWDLGLHISNGYRFIMKNYRLKDKICIFGFSRGAYVARCLAGMLNKVGLLPAANVQQVSHAYHLYKKADTESNWKTCNLFKRTFCIDVDIQFLGVWDTVASVGMLNARRMPFTASNTIIRTFRHAISLDERRARFQVKTWSTSNVQEAKLDVVDQEIQLMKTLAKSEQNGKGKGKAKQPGKNELAALRELEKKYSVERTRMTDVKEVWFAGTHTDVGGGSVKNGTKPNLAHIPLRWMIREIFRTDTGIIFNSLALARLGMDPNSLHPVVLERGAAIPASPSDFIQTRSKVQVPPDALEVSAWNESYEALLAESEEERDKRDALAPLYDRLSGRGTWWILEYLPMRQEQDDDGHEQVVWCPWNLGRGRKIPHSETNQKIMVHRTVETRLRAQYANGTKYVPWAMNFDENNVQWVN